MLLETELDDGDIEELQLLDQVLLLEDHVEGQTDELDESDGGATTGEVEDVAIVDEGQLEEDGLSLDARLELLPEALEIDEDESTEDDEVQLEDDKNTLGETGELSIEDEED